MPLPAITKLIGCSNREPVVVTDKEVGRARCGTRGDDVRVWDDGAMVRVGVGAAAGVGAEMEATEVVATATA